MRRFFRKLLNKYYDRLISNHKETWRGEYYKYLKNFATGDNWKKTVKPRFKKKLAAHIKREGKEWF